MTGALFLPQSNLDRWLESGQVDMGGHDALILLPERDQLAMVPAVRFAKVVDGLDPQKLVGKVKAVEALRLGGAEISLGAVVLGDTAYEVEDGFMLTVELPEKPAARPANKGNAGGKGQEADLLAQFILNKLS